MLAHRCAHRRTHFGLFDRALAATGNVEVERLWTRCSEERGCRAATLWFRAKVDEWRSCSCSHTRRKQPITGHKRHSLSGLRFGNRQTGSALRAPPICRCPPLRPPATASMPWRYALFSPTRSNRSRGIYGRRANCDCGHLPLTVPDHCFGTPTFDVIEAAFIVWVVRWFFEDVCIDAVGLGIVGGGGRLASRMTRRAIGSK